MLRQTSTEQADTVKEVFGPRVFLPGIASAILLSLMVGYSYYWNIQNVVQGWQQLALSEARSHWNKDASFRQWATLHGGLYVKPDDRTPANPYLSHLPDRDYVTTDGIKLTLMNPAYMMRQMTEEFEDNYGIKGKITGKVFLNPINKPDDWQKKVLTLFEDTNLDEFYEEQVIVGKRYLRYMKPMYMTEGCVKCHGHLGFQNGELRGGVSLSIPLSGYLATAAETNRSIFITHLVVWVCGIFAISIVTILIKSMLFKISDNVLALSRSNTYFKDILETAHDAILSVGEDGIVSVYNEGAERIFGYGPAEVIGQNISILMTHADATKHDSYIQRYLTTLKPRIVGQVREMTAQHKNGHPIPVRIAISDTNIPGPMRFTGIISNLTDIYKARNELLEHRKQLESTVKERTAELESANSKLKKLSELDPLTSIANRRAYDNKLSTFMTISKRCQEPLSIFMIDIDFFKPYNDNYGHDAGDIAIQRVAEAIESLLPRSIDFVARYGGEEFVVLLPNTGTQGAQQVAERLRKGVMALAIAHAHSDVSDVVTVSIGIATFGDEMANQCDLQKSADLALYDAKNSGRNCCRTYIPNGEQKKELDNQ